MVKKRQTTKKKSKIHIKKPASISRSPEDARVERVLVENFVTLQRVITNMSIKFDSLAREISRLLDLFETAAKSLSRKDIGINQGQINTEEINKKIDTLTDQNKIIAKGLTLLHEKNTGQIERSNPIAVPRSMQHSKVMSNEMAGYQRSISAKPIGPPNSVRPIGGNPKPPEVPEAEDMEEI